MDFIVLCIGSKGTMCGSLELSTVREIGNQPNPSFQWPNFSRAEGKEKGERTGLTGSFLNFISGYGCLR